MTTPAPSEPQLSSDRGSGFRGFRHAGLLTALLLAVATWLLHLPLTECGFVYFDDVRILKDHPELYGQASFRENLRAIFLTGFPREEPLLLRDVSWAIDSRIFGFGNAFGYHLGNVLLHGIVVALMFAFLLGTTRRHAFALATSVAYLVLAVHTEPVAWIMGRKDILSALFMLLALCAQTRRLIATGIAAGAAWSAATLVFVVCGLLSKISVLAFPLVLFLHAALFPFLRGDRAPDSPFPWRRSLVVEMLLLAPAAVAVVAVYVWYRRTLGQMGIFDRGYTAHGLAHLWNLLMINPMGLWIYLRQLLLPRDLTLFYTWPTLMSAYPMWQQAAAPATVAAAGVAGVWLFLRRKDLFFYYASFFVLMVPYMNLTYIGIWVADRYLYFAAFCILVIAVSLAGDALQRPVLRIFVLTAVGVCLAVNLFHKLSYQTEWRTPETLWKYHMSLPHPHVAAFENLAAYFYAVAQDSRDTAGANLPLRKMDIVVESGLAEFWPDRTQPPPYTVWYLFFLRSLLEEVYGKPEAALTSLLASDRLHPGFDATNRNLARLYARLAAAAKDRAQRTEYARNAEDRFNEYLQLAFRGRAPSADTLRELEELRARLTTLTESK